MEFKLEKFNRNIPDEDLIADLRRVAANKGSLMSSRYYNENGSYTSGTISSRFGSWNAALKAAGIEPLMIRDVSDEILYENLEEVWVRLGRQPKFRDMANPISPFSASTYSSRFGSWRKALEKFVEVANDLSKEEVMEVEDSPVIGQNPCKHKTKRNVNWRLRFKVFSRDHYRCVACGRSPAKDPEIELHADHIIPWSKCGETIIENLQTLCSICNLGKSNIEV